MWVIAFNSFLPFPLSSCLAKSSSNSFLFPVVYFQQITKRVGDIMRRPQKFLWILNNTDRYSVPHHIWDPFIVTTGSSSFVNLLDNSQLKSKMFSFQAFQLSLYATRSVGFNLHKKSFKSVQTNRISIRSYTTAWLITFCLQIEEFIFFGGLCLVMSTATNQGVILTPCKNTIFDFPVPQVFSCIICPSSVLIDILTA